MATKSITITEDAYERLKAHKRDDESFSDVVTRLTRGDRNVTKGLGAWTGTGLADAVEGTREQFDRDLRERTDALSGQ